MKLKKLDRVSAPPFDNKQPTVTLRKKGVCNINSALAELMKLKTGGSVALFQDENEPDNWYIAKDSKDGFAVRQSYDKQSTSVMFNASGAVKQIFEHFNYEETSARCVVGKEPVKDNGFALFPIMFSSAQHREKPKRKYTRRNAEETED